MRVISLASLLGFALVIGISIQAAAPDETLIGIASKYTGDAGIEKDPKVLFAEHFDEASLGDLKKRWDEVKEIDGMSFADDAPAGSATKRSLLVTQVGGHGEGGQLYRRLLPGYNKIYARFYVKFAPDCAPIHHFGTCIGGNNPATPWPSVNAGHRIDGAKSFWSGIEPYGKSWTWDYYTYWSAMRGSPPHGQTWGNSFVRDSGLKLERDRWICVETMIKMNDVGDTNGELALWLDGKPISHLGKGFPKGQWTYDKFTRGKGGDSVRWSDEKNGPEYFKAAKDGDPFEGFAWRTVKELNVNFIWAYLYITVSGKGGAFLTGFRGSRFPILGAGIRAQFDARWLP